MKYKAVKYDKCFVVVVVVVAVVVVVVVVVVVCRIQVKNKTTVMLTQ